MYLCLQLDGGFNGVSPWISLVRAGNAQEYPLHIHILRFLNTPASIMNDISVHGDNRALFFLLLFLPPSSSHTACLLSLWKETAHFILQVLPRWPRIYQDGIFKPPQCRCASGVVMVAAPCPVCWHVSRRQGKWVSLSEKGEIIIMRLNNLPPFSWFYLGVFPLLLALLDLLWVLSWFCTLSAELIYMMIYSRRGLGRSSKFVLRYTPKILRDGLYWNVATRLRVPRLYVEYVRATLSMWSWE